MADECSRRVQDGPEAVAARCFAKCGARQAARCWVNAVSLDASLSGRPGLSVRELAIAWVLLERLLEAGGPAAFAEGMLAFHYLAARSPSFADAAGAAASPRPLLN